MPVFAAVDVGGTFLKGAIISPDVEHLQFVVRGSGTALIRDEEGRAELDPLVLLEKVKLLVRELVANVQKIDGILLTGQMHGCVLTDRELRPMSRVITWQDELQYVANGVKISPTAPVKDVLTEELIRQTGNELRSGLPICTLKARASRGLDVVGLRFHSLISYIAHGLVENGSKGLMHITDAAASGFFDINRMLWDEDVLQRVGLNELDFPMTTTAIEPIGNSIIYGCPIYVAVGDQQASLYSVNLGDDEISLNIATGSQVSRVTDQPSYLGQVRPYFNGKYLATITHIPAGRSLNLLVEFLTSFSNLENDVVWRKIEEQTMATPVSDLNVNLSFFDSYTGRRGSIQSISEQNLTIGNLFRSASQTMAKNYRQAAEILMQPFRPSSIVITGGLAKRFIPIREEISNVFSAFPIREYDDEDASLGGLHSLVRII